MGNYSGNLGLFGLLAVVAAIVFVAWRNRGRGGTSARRAGARDTTFMPDHFDGSTSHSGAHGGGADAGGHGVDGAWGGGDSSFGGGGDGGSW